MQLCRVATPYLLTHPSTGHYLSRYYDHCSTLHTPYGVSKKQDSSPSYLLKLLGSLYELMVYYKVVGFRKGPI